MVKLSQHTASSMLPLTLLYFMVTSPHAVGGKDRVQEALELAHCPMYGTVGFLGLP